MKSAVALLIISTVLAGCATKTKNPAAAAPAPQPENPVIVRLVNQHQTVTITAGRDGSGPLYSVTDANGKTIVARATLEELKTNHPDLYRQIEPSIAVHADVDARGRTPSRPRGQASDRMMMDSQR